MDLQTEVAPQVVGQTGIAGVAIALPLAAGRIDGFVDRVDHLRHMDARHMAGQLVAAARAAHAGHQVATAQLGEQLFEIGQEMPWRSEISASETGPC